jgi:transposase
LEEKLRIVKRLDRGESGRQVAAELGMDFSQVYRWYRAWKARGEEGLRRGQIQAALTGRETASVDRAPRAGGDEQRIAELERKIGQQALELDFLSTALRHVEGSRRQTGLPGETVSTPASRRRRSGKAD